MQDTEPVESEPERLTLQTRLTQWQINALQRFGCDIRLSSNNSWYLALTLPAGIIREQVSEHSQYRSSRITFSQELVIEELYHFSTKISILFFSPDWRAYGDTLPTSSKQDEYDAPWYYTKE